MKENQPTARRYDREFKENAVALVRGGRTISGVARDLGVTTWSLGRWVQLARTGGGQREPAALAAESEEGARGAPPAPGGRSPAPAKGHPKKSVGHLVSGSASTRYTLMQKIQDEHPVAALAEALEVSESGFHAHRHKDRGQRRQEDGELSAAIAPVFTASRQTYGCPRVAAALRQGGVRCGKNRVARLMREHDLRPKAEAPTLAAPHDGQQPPATGRRELAG